MVKIANYLANCLVTNKIIKKEDYEIYVYGIERFEDKVFGYIVLFFLSVIMKSFVCGLLFLLFFIPLRGRTGGYHASTRKECFLATTVGFIFVVKILVPIFLERNLYFLFFISCGVICWLAPINHPKLDFRKEELREYSRRAKIILGVEIVAILLFKFYHIEKAYIVSAMLGTVLCALLLCIAKLKGQEVKEDEKK